MISVVAMYFVQKSVARQTGESERSDRRVRRAGTLHLSNTPSKNGHIRNLRHCLVHIKSPKIVDATGWLCNPARLETVIMNPRLAAMAALCREVAIPASVLAFAAFSSAGHRIIPAAAPIMTASRRCLPLTPRLPTNHRRSRRAAADAVVASPIDNGGHRRRTKTGGA